MRKIAIFNVGGALSTYIEFDDIKIMADLGSSVEFSPIEDFLAPLAEKRSFDKIIIGEEEKYKINQLFISHLDNDHISDFEKFKEKFYAEWMTCPNDNTNPSKEDDKKQHEDFIINPDLLSETFPVRETVLNEMRRRQPILSDSPLISINENIRLYFIKPKECETVFNEKISDYANNLSLVLFIILGEKTVLIPGDLLKEGMEYLIDNNSDFKDNLNSVGIDFLIAPHHGLATSFSERLFQETKGGKTRLNIISEKIRPVDSEENRSDVDKRYYSSDYSTAENDLKQNAVKTSGGHIVIDLETAETEIKQIETTEELINEFII